jgi:hypothetical protein
MEESENEQVTTGEDAEKVKGDEKLDFLNKPIGNIEKPSIKPEIVTIVSVVIKTKKSDGTAMKVPAASILVKHPGKPEPLTLSKVSYLDGKTVKTGGLWVQLDDDGNIQKSSAVDRLVSYLNCKTLKEIEGKTIDTVQESEESKYLSLKAY